MKKLNQILTAALLVCGTLILFPSFTTTDSNVIVSVETVGDNTCRLQVKTSYGSAAKSIKVSTDVSGGISCAGGRSFYTDSDGMVTLEWSSGCQLKQIYVDGRGYEVNYRDGGDYTITMK